MYYSMMLVVTRCLMWVSIILVALYALVVAVAASQGLLGHPLQDANNAYLPLPAFFAVAGFVAAGCGSRFARILSEQNESHLPVVWTMPVSRTRYALTMFAVGSVGVLGAFALTLAAVFAFLATFRALPFVVVTGDSALELVRYLLFAFAFYGLLTALTASFGKPGRGLIGGGWMASVIIAGLAGAGFPQPWSAIFGALDLINPWRYASYSSGAGSQTVKVMTMPDSIMQVALTADIAALAILALLGFAAGIWQWRRVEA